MEKFIWTENFNTSIQIIDLQHRELFEKIDTFALAIYKGESKKHLAVLLQFLETYIENHFTVEENIMMLNSYADFSAHAALHTQFRKTFDSFKNDFAKNGGDSYLAIRLEKEIRRWWESHILSIDKKYVPFIQKTS